MTPLTEGLNIGKVLEIKLNAIGITTIEQLKSVGTEKVFKRLKMIDKNCVVPVVGISRIGCFSIFCMIYLNYKKTA
ncbi:MAG: hypothetical protein GX879_07135 [Bacteroidales bacterium]|nr:hypothetical protein [Bacteroidales bacterium]